MGAGHPAVRANSYCTAGGKAVQLHSWPENRFLHCSCLRTCVRRTTSRSMLRAALVRRANVGILRSTYWSALLPSRSMPDLVCLCEMLDSISARHHHRTWHCKAG
eukprot:3372240-Amphidinium_carterae.1